MASGFVDPTFNPGNGSGFGSDVYALALQPNGKVIVGGYFADYNDGTNHPCGRIARLNANGTFDPSFTPVGSTGFAVFANVFALALQPDGKVIVGGIFVNYNDGANHPCGNVVRLNADGTFDPSFTPVGSTGFDSPGTGIYSLALQPDGKVIVGGYFANYNDGANHPCGNIARLNADGTFDPSFDPMGSTEFDSPGAVVLTLALQPDGKVIVGGGFNNYNDGAGHPCGNIVRLNTNGTFDPLFTPVGSTGFDSPGALVFTLALQPDGKVIAGGYFTNYNDGANHSCGRIARLNIDGTFDSSFTPVGSTGFDSFASVDVLELQPDGKVIVGGYFTGYNDGTNHVVGNIIRLNADGTFDSSFTPAGSTGFDTLSASVFALALQPNGKVIVGGYFNNYNDGTDHAAGKIIRLIAFSVPPLLLLSTGENFRMLLFESLSSVGSAALLSIPLSPDPGTEPGSICISPGGGLLIRKPDGTIGTIL